MRLGLQSISGPSVNLHDVRTSTKNKISSILLLMQFTTKGCTVGLELFRYKVSQHQAAIKADMVYTHLK